MGYYTIEWAEDVDLSGGTGNVALGLAAGNRGPWTRATVDNARAPYRDGLRIKHLWAVNETVCNSTAAFYVSENQRSPYTVFPINLGTTIVPTQRLYNVNIPIPAGATMYHYGFDGGGAEQSVGVMMIDDPGYQDCWNLKAPDSSYDEVVVVRPTTAARVANTVSGHTDICGRAVAYTGGQAAIPASSKTTIDVLHIQSNDVAGYSGATLVSSQGAGANLTLPCAATMGENWYMPEIFDGQVPSCTADDPFDIAGVGVTTATMTLSALTLGINYR